MVNQINNIIEEASGKKIRKIDPDFRVSKIPPDTNNSIADLSQRTIRCRVCKQEEQLPDFLYNEAECWGKIRTFTAQHKHKK